MKYKIKAIHAGEDTAMCNEVFDSKNELRKRLASFHSADWSEEKSIDSLSLDDLLEHGQWELIEIAYKCPLCHDGDVVYRHWKSTPIYSCEACLFLAMEYRTNEDLLALTDYLKFN